MSSFNSSRSNPNVETNDETYETIDLYLGSQRGSIPLLGYPNINTGFTCVLANPLVLDIAHRYVIALIQGEFDTTNYPPGTLLNDIYIYCDLLEYQYDHGDKTQLLYGVYNVSTTKFRDFDVPNVAWKFINPTQKVIRELSFWLLDAAGNPLSLPANARPTNLNVLIKKVNSHVVATTQL
jgi:hypothetical protein